MSAMPTDTAVRLLRAKAAELETYVQANLGMTADDELEWLIADVALIAGILADFMETGSAVVG